MNTVSGIVAGIRRAADIVVAVNSSDTTANAPDGFAMVIFCARFLVITARRIAAQNASRFRIAGICFARIVTGRASNFLRMIASAAFTNVDRAFVIIFRADGSIRQNRMNAFTALAFVSRAAIAVICTRRIVRLCFVNALIACALSRFRAGIRRRRAVAVLDTLPGTVFGIAKFVHHFRAAGSVGILRRHGTFAHALFVVAHEAGEAAFGTWARLFALLDKRSEIFEMRVIGKRNHRHGHRRFGFVPG